MRIKERGKEVEKKRKLVSQWEIKNKKKKIRPDGVIFVCGFDRFLIAAVCVAIIAFLIFDVALRQPSRLVSVLGVVVFVAFMFFFSHSPRQVPRNRYDNPIIIHSNTVIYHSNPIVNNGNVIKRMTNITDTIIAAIVGNANKYIINDDNEV